MSKEENFIQAFNEAERDARRGVDCVRDTASALHRVGSPLAQELYEAVAILEDSIGNMGWAINAELSRQVKTADSHIAEALIACLNHAVMTVGESSVTTGALTVRLNQ